MALLLQHPQLAGCRRLFLRNHEVRIHIGVHDFEKQGEQRVLINVDLFVPLQQSTPQADELHEVVDYDFVRRVIGERVARVSTEKPDVYPDCDAVGVEVFGLRSPEN
jgi:dihydroneopterin aldolase